MSSRILIVLGGSLGDVARAMALVVPLRQSYPDAYIAWLVEPQSAGLVSLHSDLNEVIVFERARGLRGVWAAIKAVRKRKFDLVIDLQRILKSGLFAFLSGASKRLCFNRANSKEGNWLFGTETVAFVEDTAPKLLNYFEFLKTLGVPVPKEPDFGLTGACSSDALGPLGLSEKSKYLACVIGSAWPSKDWPVDHYIELIRRVLSELSLEVVLLGTKGQLEIAKTIENQVASPNVHSLVGKTDIKALCAVLKQAVVAVGPDTGTGHLAVALGCRYVSLFGPTTPSRTAPYGCEDLVLSAEVGCAPCYKRHCPGLGGICMQLISPEMVFSCIGRELARKEFGVQ